MTDSSRSKWHLLTAKRVATFDSAVDLLQRNAARLRAGVLAGFCAGLTLSLVFLGVGIPNLAGAESPDPMASGEPAGGGISGVVSVDGGGTLEEICVIVEEASFSFGDFTTTDDQGAFSFRGLLPGQYVVRFRECPNIDSTLYIPEWYDDQPDRSSADRITVTDQEVSGIDAALATGGSINGTVTDEVTGEPLADVCILAVDTSLSFSGSARTDSSGNYSVGGLASADYHVSFEDCSFPSVHLSEWYDSRGDRDASDLVSVTSGEKTPGIDAALAVGGSINGVVTDESTGEPLADICVDVEGDTSSSIFDFARTDSSGDYSVGPLASGDYQVFFEDCNSPPTHLSEWYDNRLDSFVADHVQVTVGIKTAGIDAALAAGGSINGMVTDQSTGEPLAGICISVSNNVFGFEGGFSSTDSSGNYSVGRLASGEYTVFFRDCSIRPVYFPEWYDNRGATDALDLVSVTTGRKTAGIDAALVASGSINGVVTDETTGEPLANICVIVNEPSNSFDFDSFSGFTQTDSSGNYSVGFLAPADYYVVFSDCGFPVDHDSEWDYATEWYDDQPREALADAVPVAFGLKVSGIGAALSRLAVTGGDVNCSGRVDSIDGALVLQFVAD